MWKTSDFAPHCWQVAILQADKIQRGAQAVHRKTLWITTQQCMEIGNVLASLHTARIFRDRSTLQLTVQYAANCFSGLSFPSYTQQGDTRTTCTSSLLKKNSHDGAKPTINNTTDKKKNITKYLTKSYAITTHVMRSQKHGHYWPQQMSAMAKRILEPRNENGTKREV